MSTFFAAVLIVLMLCLCVVAVVGTYVACKNLLKSLKDAPNKRW